MILRAIEGFSEGGDEGVCSVGGAGGGGFQREMAPSEASTAVGNLGGQGDVCK